MTDRVPVEIAGIGLHPFGRFGDRTVTEIGVTAVRAACTCVWVTVLLIVIAHSARDVETTRSLAAPGPGGGTVDAGGLNPLVLYGRGGSNPSPGTRNGHS